MDRCPGTLSGKKVEGMKTNDVLLDLDPDIKWWDQKAVVCCALAEIFGGYVTALCGDDAEGFYFSNKQGVSEFFHFEKVLCFDWADQVPHTDPSDDKIVDHLIFLMKIVRGEV